jgi:hypothetical protein|uniref:PqqD family protein n=1 Tax=Desulfobacca acetoxidans TaxID=60893 RepID=A0A7C5AMA4_9BACT
MPKTIQLKDDLLMTEKDEMLYVLDLESGRIHCFNQTAKVIVQLCLKPRSPEEISEEYRQYFGLEAGMAQKDVMAILEKLAFYHLLREDVKP